VGDNSSTGADQEDKSIVKDASRFLRKLRRKVYRELPIATWNRVAEADGNESYDSLISTFRRGDCGALSGGAALALRRAAADAGFRAWCYDFGFPESLTHMVTVVEADGRLQVHDPFLNLGYRGDFYEILEGLRADRLPDIRCETRDRKIYVVDPSCESQLVADWLTAHADRELDRVGSLRRFEVLWDSDALRATLARPEAVYRDLETRGYPADLSYLMLHPIGVFDGRAHHRNPETMPLIGGRDLRSPVAGLRAAMQQLTQDLAVERDQLAVKSTISGQLEGELAEARSQLLAASGEAEQLSTQAAQLRAAIDDTSRQWDAERQALSQGNSALEERRAVLEAELAEARAHHAAATEEVRRLADQVVQLRSAYDDAERRIATERELFLQQQQKLEAALGETSAHAAEIETQAQGLEQTIRTLHDATDQRTAEWEAERLLLRTAAQALEDDKRRLQIEVANTQTVLVTAHGQIAELRDTLDRRTAEWGDERRSLQEAAQVLEDDKRQLQAEVAETREHLATARGQIAEMNDTLDRHTAEWGDERRSLQEAARVIEDDKQRLRAEVLEAWEDLAKADGQIAGLRDTLAYHTAEWDGERRSLQEAAQALKDDNQQLHAGVLDARGNLAEAHRRLRDVENQAAWSGLQIAELVEKDAAAASDVALGREEITILRTRVVDLQSELRSAEVELIRRDAAVDGFATASKQLLGVDALASTDLLAVLAHLRQHLRQTERELDRAEAERDRLRAALKTPAGQRRPSTHRLGNFWRGLMAWRVDHGEKLNRLGGDA
jgi:predicted  nucleic acid-binding Zn-ribbon protein